MAHGFFNVFFFFFFVSYIYMECKTCVTHGFFNDFNGLFGGICSCPTN